MLLLSLNFVKSKWVWIETIGRDRLAAAMKKILLAALTVLAILLIILVFFTKKAENAPKAPQAAPETQSSPQVESEPEHKSPFSQKELTEIKNLEMEWANDLDIAGKLAADKKYNEAETYVEKSKSAVSAICSLIKSKNCDPRRVDVIIGYENLSAAYGSLIPLMQMAEKPKEVIGKEKEAIELLKNATRGLEEARKRFETIPALKNFCDTLLAELNKINDKLKGYLK